MVVLSVFILFIIFESSKLLSNAVNTYCTLPCPFMCPAQQPKTLSVIQLPPRRPTPTPIGRTSEYESYPEYDDTPESEPLPPPPPVPKLRQQQPPDPDPPTPPSPPPKPKPKPPPAEDVEPPPKKRNSSSSPPPSSPPPSSPSIQPSRRFFTSLFSIPGAVVDTLIGGEITL